MIGIAFRVEEDQFLHRDYWMRKNESVEYCLCGVRLASDVAVQLDFLQIEDSRDARATRKIINLAFKRAGERSDSSPGRQENDRGKGGRKTHAGLDVEHRSTSFESLAGGVHLREGHRKKPKAHPK